MPLPEHPNIYVLGAEKLILTHGVISGQPHVMMLQRKPEDTELPTEDEYLERVKAGEGVMMIFTSMESLTSFSDRMLRAVGAACGVEEDEVEDFIDAKHDEAGFPRNPADLFGLGVEQKNYFATTLPEHLIVHAAVETYHARGSDDSEPAEHNVGARAALRTLMMKLNLYGEFGRALEAHEKGEADGNADEPEAGAP